jgi:2-oxoglutarate ferredoxin oxidoreductase subunit alpha
MTDLYLCESITSLEMLNLDIKIDRGWLLNEGEIKDYKRYMITETGVSPRALPGQKGYNFVAASDEHDEKGNLVSDILAGLPQMLKIRNAIMEKRMRKEKYIIQEFPPPKLYGDEEADITIVCWGSTCSTVREAIEELNKEGIKANSLEIKYIHPFQAEEVKNILMKAKRLLLVENNYGALMGKLIAENTGIIIKDALLRYDGEPITPLQVVYKVKEILVR